MRSRLLIVAAYLLWSTTGIFVRESGLPVPNFVVMGNLVGIALLFIVAPRRLADFRKLPAKPLLAFGLFGAVNVWSSFEAFRLTSLGGVMILHYTAPVIVAAVAPLVIRERPSSRTWEALGLSMLGLIAVASEDLGPLSDDDFLGLSLALLSGFAYAGVILCGRAMARARVDPVGITIVQSMFLPILAMPLVDLGAYTAHGLSFAAAAGVLHLTLAAILCFRGMRETPAATTATIGYLEILFALFWGLLLYGEPISIQKVIGAALIIASGILVLRDRNLSSPIPQPPIG